MLKLVFIFKCKIDQLKHENYFLLRILSMSITLKTHKMLWGQAANRCAFETCRKELVVNNFTTNDSYTIGDEAHIISKRKAGPRPQLKYDFPFGQLDKYDNLILLCKEHHKSIDSDENFYSIAEIKRIKNEHEAWVREKLKPDRRQQEEDELFADYIEQIELLASFDNWLDWTANLQGGGIIKIMRDQYDKLIILHKYLSSRIFPKSRLALVEAIKQFNCVLEDFINEFDLYMDDETDPKYYWTKQLYRLQVVTPEKQDLHEYMLEELIVELTKAGNYLSEQVRQTIYTAYRLHEGILLLKDAPTMGISYRRMLYGDAENYCGLITIRERTKKRLGQK